jgi:hypothetical protein
VLEEKLDDSKDLDNAMVGGSNKMKIGLSDFRLQCRISCGADHVVENVWPYILPPDYVRFYVNVEEVEEEENVDNYYDYGNTEVTMTMGKRKRRNRNMAVIRLVRTMKWRMTMTILRMLMTKNH